MKLILNPILLIFLIKQIAIQVNSDEIDNTEKKSVFGSLTSGLSYKPKYLSKYYNKLVPIKKDNSDADEESGDVKLQESNSKSQTTEDSKQSDTKIPNEDIEELSKDISTETQSVQSTEQTNQDNKSGQSDPSNESAIDSDPEDEISQSSAPKGKGQLKGKEVKPSANNQTKASFFNTVKSGISKETSKLKGASEKKTDLLKKYYSKYIASPSKKRGVDDDDEEGDVHLQAFKGGHKNQTVKEQAETDGFFASLGNKWGRSCFDNIGCFSAIDTYDSALRPIPLLPMSPNKIKPVFHLYTIDSRSVPRNYSYNVSSVQLKYSTYRPELKTAFIIHGYQSGYALWMENLKDYILYKSGDKFNVVVVVWEKGSKIPIYNLAATNTRVVGACIGFFIETLCKTFNITNDKFYLIGHSLGAHTAGYAGKRLFDPKAARIVALDPAGVGFHFPTSRMRLDSSDATIVDVIHTDAAMTYTEGFGTADTWGHFDFYPNGGVWQPGCPESNGVTQKLSSIRAGGDITCSHSRACLIMNDLNKPEDDCQSVAYSCPSYDIFLEGRCADCSQDKCSLMGINPDIWFNQKPNNKTIGRKYFVNTSHREEYCLQHYQFGLHTTNDSDACTGHLHFKLNMQLSGNETKEVDIERMMTRSTQGKIHTFLVNFDFYIDQITALELRWKRFNRSDLTRTNRGYKLKIPFIEINYMSHIDRQYRKKRSSLLCLTGNIIANKGRHMYEECDEGVAPKQRADEVEPSKLVALEAKEDIHSVDYKRIHRVFHKVNNTRIKEKIMKYEFVN